MSGGTVLLLFCLHLDSHSFKVVRKFYLPHPALFLLMYSTNLKIFCYLTLAVFYKLSIITADQNMSFHG